MVQFLSLFQKDIPVGLNDERRMTGAESWD